MNRGTLQTFRVQQIMASDDASWWIHNNAADHPGNGPSPPPVSLPSLLPSHFVYHRQHLQNSPSSSASNSSSIPLHAGWPSYQVPEQFPDSWSHLNRSRVYFRLSSQSQEIFDREGFAGEVGIENFERTQARKTMNWEGPLHQSASASLTNISFVDIKREIPPTNSFGYRHLIQEFSPNSSMKQSWCSTSPSSCVTNSLNGSHNMMEFASSTKKAHRPSFCCSNSNAGANKKARLLPTAPLPAYKVRKEKLGDRINALHQLVSPFGKTDTASVLLEVIGYIRFLQNQIEALSSPYMGQGSKLQHSLSGVNSLFSDEPDKDGEERKIDLSSKGLCLVPISCTLEVGSDNGADYWAPALGGGFR